MTHSTNYSQQIPMPHPKKLCHTPKNSLLFCETVSKRKNFPSKFYIGPLIQGHLVFVFFNYMSGGEVMSTIKLEVTPCCPQHLHFCSNKRANSDHFPPISFVCVPVLKCEGFVNAPIFLWQRFYLTDTSHWHRLFSSHQCSPQHSSGQLYPFFSDY